MTIADRDLALPLLSFRTVTMAAALAAGTLTAPGAVSAADAPLPGPPPIPVPDAGAADPRVNPAPTVEVTKTIATTCTWTRAGEMMPRTAPASVDVQVTLPTTVGPAQMFEASNLVTSISIPQDPTVFPESGVYETRLSHTTFTFGTLDFGLPTDSRPLTATTPLRTPAEGTVNFAALAYTRAVGNSIPVRYAGFSVRVSAGAPYRSWPIDCVPTGDGLVASIPIQPAPTVPVFRVVGQGIAGFGGLIEVRGTNLSKVKSVHVYGKRAPFWYFGGRLFVAAPALRAGLYPVTLETKQGELAYGQLRYQRLF